MIDDLTLKAKVITDLMEKGAQEVTIVGTDIKVTRSEYKKIVGIKKFSFNSNCKC